jgi:hypothetical protein
MGVLTGEVRAIRRKKLTQWGIRQVISACIITPIVWKWPHLMWLVYVWVPLALLALVLLLIAFGKLEQQLRAIGAVNTDVGDDKEENAAS